MKSMQNGNLLQMEGILISNYSLFVGNGTWVRAAHRCKLKRATGIEIFIIIISSRNELKILILFANKTSLSRKANAEECNNR